MKLSSILLLAFASILSLSFCSVDAVNNVISPNSSLELAIDLANDRVGSDSIFVSSLSSEYMPDEYLISDHVVLVNDVNSMSDLLSKDITFTIALYGHLELVDFDLKALEAKIINRGSMSLIDCTFQEGKYLGDYISNNGAFRIKNGLFIGSKDGNIIRDAVFSHGARLIL